MTTLAEALAAEREQKRRDAEDAATRREVGMAVLTALAQRLNTEPLPSWQFITRGEELILARTHAGAGPREYLGAWSVDREMRLVLDGETTEWITAESCARVVDRAVKMTARFIVEAEDRGMALPLHALTELSELQRRV